MAAIPYKRTEKPSKAETSVEIVSLPRTEPGTKNHWWWHELTMFFDKLNLVMV